MSKDLEKAAYWCRKAADQNYAQAQYTLAVIYARGAGVPEDREKAVALLERAAFQGHQKAIDLIKKLASQGHREAKAVLDRIDQEKLLREQIAENRKKLDALKQQDKLLREQIAKSQRTVPEARERKQYDLLTDPNGKYKYSHDEAMGILKAWDALTEHESKQSQSWDR